MALLSLSLESSPARAAIALGFMTPVLYLIAHGIYNAFFHPLSKVPGPKIYAFTQVPYFYHLLQGDWHRHLKTLHDQYGPVVRFTVNDVSFITTDAIKKIYGHKKVGEKTFEKSLKAYRHGRPGTQIVNAPNDDHRRMRRLLAHAFSEKALRNQEAVLQCYTDKFIDRLASHAGQGNILDLTQWYNFTTFDLIGDLAFGEPFHCLDTGGYHPWVKMIFDGIKSLPIAQIARRLGLLHFAPYLTPKHLMRAAQEHHQLSRQTVLRRLETKDTKREDFMSYILRHNDERGMSTDEIIDNASILIMAGSETSATALCATTFLLLANRDKLDTLVQEIRSSFVSEEEITIQRVKQLPYLEAVFQESLRMHPPVPGVLPRETPEGGEIVEGYWLPENTLISAPHWPAFRSARNFRDPSMFVPERWLGDPRYADDIKAMFQPFSMGPRDCIGKNLAHAEMRLILTRLLWNFDAELMSESKDWDRQRTFVLWEKGVLNVKLTRVTKEPEVKS